MLKTLKESFEKAIQEGKDGILIYANEIAFKEISPEFAEGSNWNQKILERIYKGEEAVIKSGYQGNSQIVGVVIFPVERLKETMYFFSMCQKWEDQLCGPVSFI